MQDSNGDWKIYKPSQHGTMTPVSQAMPKQHAIDLAELMNQGKVRETPPEERERQAPPASSRPGIYGIGRVSSGPPRGGAALQIWQRRQWGDSLVDKFVSQLLED